MSSIKSLLYDFFVGSMVFYITTHIVSGITTSGFLSHWLMLFAVFFAANLMVPQLLKFLTIPKNFLMFWLTSAICSFAALYAMSLFIPGVIITETLIDPVSLGIISVNPYTLGPDATIVIAGVVAGLLNALLFWLKKD